MSKEALYTINPLLKAYRRIAEGKEPLSDTERMVRDVQEKQPAKFLDNWRDLEKDHTQALVKAKEMRLQEKTGTSPSVQTGPDSGAQKCIELCERWLKENAGVAPVRP